MKEILKYSGCFVCGDRNPCGLKARFHYDGEKAVTSITATEAFEGYRGIYHGGLISTLLDEVMIKAILAVDRYAVTAEMTVRFLSVVDIGDHVTLTGTVVRRKGRVFFTEGQATKDSGELVATATGKYVEADADLAKILRQSVE